MTRSQLITTLLILVGLFWAVSLYDRCAGRSPHYTPPRSSEEQRKDAETQRLLDATDAVKKHPERYP